MTQVAYTSHPVPLIDYRAGPALTSPAIGNRTRKRQSSLIRDYWRACNASSSARAAGMSAAKTVMHLRDQVSSGENHRLGQARRSVLAALRAPATKKAERPFQGSRSSPPEGM